MAKHTRRRRRSKDAPPREARRSDGNPPAATLAPSDEDSTSRPEARHTSTRAGLPSERAGRKNDDDGDFATFFRLESIVDRIFIAIGRFARTVLLVLFRPWKIARDLDHRAITPPRSFFTVSTFIAVLSVRAASVYMALLATLLLLF